MSGSLFNKVAGAIILVALTLVVISTIGNALVRPKAVGEATAVAVKAPEKPAAEAKTEEPPVQIASLLPTADIKVGEKVFKKCRACHTVDKGGANKVGPNLWNIVNRELGKGEGFSYSKALLEKGGTWTYESLNAFFLRPKAHIPGTKMAFAGLKKPKDRAAVIAYLRSLSDSPAPLP